MLGKYDFKEEHIDEVLNYFALSLSNTFMWLKLVKEHYKKFDLDYQRVNKMIKMLRSIEFFHEFQSVRDLFYDWYDQQFMYFLKLDEQSIEFDRDILQPRMISLKETIITTDKTVRFIYDFIAKHNRLPDKVEVVDFLLVRAVDYISAIEKLYQVNKFILNPQQKDILKNLKEEIDVDEWILGIELTIGIYEDEFAHVKAKNDPFDNGFNDYWKINGILYQIQVICELANNISEN
ncbi:hypothetical protein [Spiroplasma culicicola]|uniref:Uncharacterized protein n=1 Tax=Spiroplasma culicicola AES-1 TaxID=1276246 RepID=W6AGN1_9MOLU|nr:hypothetical protein [Spiroplasma culicicola]AHI52839.1 hypothetical protein SCULI_v1c04980 [Spiroplasma culicicola AES-1]